jgi:hypothetical protein
MLMSSTKPFLETYNALLSTVSSRLLIKKRNRIENTSNSYGISVFIFSISDFSSATFIVVVRLVTKLYIYLMIDSGTLRLRRL